jgi:hypothetical protein
VQVDPDFQRKLDEFNRSQNAHVDIAVTWDTRRRRWQVWAIPTADSSHPHYNPKMLLQLARTLPDGSGRSGVKLFLWARYDEQGQDAGYLPLDDRLLDSLRMADSFRSRNHFDEVITEPELQKEITLKQRLRDIAYGARSYWWGLDRLSIAPGARGGGDWRWRIR